jgi:hypothetical protein
MNETRNGELLSKSISQNAVTALRFLKEPVTLYVYRDERTLALPAGFHDRLRRRLDHRPSLGSKERVRASRRAVLAWALTAAAAVPSSFALFFAKRTILPRLGHQTPWGFSRCACGYGTCSRLPGRRRHGLSHSWLFPFAGQPQISNFFKSRKPSARPIRRADLHREVRAREKRLACSEHASLHARAHSLAGSPVPDYDVRERVSVRYNSLRSTRLKPSKLPDISITNVRTQKGPFPSLLCAFDRNGCGSTRLRARLKMPKPPQQTSFPFFSARASSPSPGGFLSAPACATSFNWPLSSCRIYLTKKYIYRLKLSANSLVTLLGSLRSFPEIL